MAGYNSYRVDNLQGWSESRRQALVAHQLERIASAGERIADALEEADEP